MTVRHRRAGPLALRLAHLAPIRYSGSAAAARPKVRAAANALAGLWPGSR